MQEAVHRIQPEEVTAQAIAWIREEGFASLNIDLIYGLPRQTPETFATTIERSLRYAPDRYAVFGYAHVPRVRGGQKVIEESDLPGPEIRLAMLKSTVETLTNRGYAYIGMDHFARENDELTLAQRAGTLQRNFQGYSTHGGTDICGFGLSAISQIETHYRQNAKNLPAYYDALDRGELPITKALFPEDDDQIRRDVIMRLMCDLALDYNALGRRLGINFREYFSSEIATLGGEPAADGLVDLTEGGVRVTDRGRLLLRNLAMLFDTYLDRKPKCYSPTV